MTTTRTPALTKRRRLRALRLRDEIRKEGAPDLLTATEADRLAREFGLASSKYGRGRPSRPVRLIDLAVYIARYETLKK